MATDEQFNNALKKLCIQDSYDSEKRPASVDRIIFPKHSLWNDAKNLLKCLLYNETFSVVWDNNKKLY